MCSRANDISLSHFYTLAAAAETALLCDQAVRIHMQRANFRLLCARPTPPRENVVVKMMIVHMQFLANGHSFIYMHSLGNHQGEKMLQLLLAECCFFVIIFIWYGVGQFGAAIWA